MTPPRIAILGAGPAGLGAAYKLARRRAAHVTVLEQNSGVGGNAGSFEVAGLRLDFGSHRLHPACDPEVLADIRKLLGSDLLDRPRHGRIRLRGRWVHFPLKPLDLALRLPPEFAAGVVSDMAGKILSRNRHSPEHESFATVLESGLGRTMCRDFYFPYARKLWGLDPDQLSETQARRRVSANSFSKMMRKVAASLPGLKPKGSGRFYYPRLGYGQISDAYAEAAQMDGAQLHLDARVTSVEMKSTAPMRVHFQRRGEEQFVDADYIWSTIPITALIRCAQPAAPQELMQAAGRIHYRSMILIYLILEQDRFSEFDAHYFPETQIRISRLSEPKNYSAGNGTVGLTALCAELPCSPEDPEWEMDDEQLRALVRESLSVAGIPIRAPIRDVITRRLRFAYPIYRKGYEVHFDQLDRWVEQFDRVLTFGRQGLFAHDNTHHALYMAYSAVSCFDSGGGFDLARWQRYREAFKSHVVED